MKSKQIIVNIFFFSLFPLIHLPIYLVDALQLTLELSTVEKQDTRDLIVFVYISVKAIFVVQNKTERNNVAKHSRQVKFIKI